jgi:hypothetical protein
MKLLEACQSAREGNFVSHKYFDTKQSMHEYNYNLYYEDGANLTSNGGMEFLEKEDWAKDGWYIKYPKEKVDKEKLRKLHDNNNGLMFMDNQSYEDCIIS